MQWFVMPPSYLISNYFSLWCEHVRHLRIGFHYYRFWTKFIKSDYQLIHFLFRTSLFIFCRFKLKCTYSQWSDVGKIQKLHTWFVLLAVYRVLMSISRIFVRKNCLLNKCGWTTFGDKLSLQVWKNIFRIIRTNTTAHRHRLRQIVGNIKWQKLKCQRMPYNESYVCLVFKKHFLTAIHITHQWWWTQCSHAISFIPNHAKWPVVVII